MPEIEEFSNAEIVALEGFTEDALSEQEALESVEGVDENGFAE